MRRREFLTLLGGAATWPLAARAQQPDDRVQVLLSRILQMQAEAAADKIADFIRGVESQVGWTTQLPWSARAIEQRRFDALRLLLQVPAITELTQLDATGKERLRVSRLAMDVVAGGGDFSNDPKFAEAAAKKVYYGPVYFREVGPVERRSMLPYMTLSLAGRRSDAGVSVAEVSLKLVWDVVARMKVGEHGVAYVVDGQGRVIAHSDIGVALRSADFSGLAQARAALAVGWPVHVARDINGREVLTTYAAVAPPGWLVFVELPADEINAPTPR
jgi:two-component system NtrC family sensor kinase